MQCTPMTIGKSTTTALVLKVKSKALWWQCGKKERRSKKPLKQCVLYEIYQ